MNTEYETGDVRFLVLSNKGSVIDVDISYCSDAIRLWPDEE